VNSIEERVIDIISDKLGVAKDQITRETSLIKDLQTDSLDIVELVMDLEEEFDLQIPDQAQQNIHTVGQIIDYIEREVKQKKSGSWEGQGTGAVTKD
jgi:acyl carrier protein